MPAYPKPKRELSEEYKAWISWQHSCYIIGAPNDIADINNDGVIRSVGHHVKTRGSGGGDIGNMIPLSLEHHNLAHMGHIPKSWQREQAFKYQLIWEEQEEL